MVSVFVPIYDTPTKHNGMLAGNVFRKRRNARFGRNATRKSLLDLILNHRTTALLLMSHGDHDCVCGYEGCVALHRDDILKNVAGVLRLPVFAWACKTSLSIGPAFCQSANNNRGAWWGYRTTVSAPSPKELDAFKDILICIVKHFPFVNNERTARQFFSDLKVICETHRNRVVEAMAQSRVYKDAHETAVAFRELWQHLDGWLPAYAQPFQCDQFFDSIVIGI